MRTLRLLLSGLVVLLALWVGGGMVPPPPPPALAARPPAPAGTALRTRLNPDGSLNLRDGFQGPLDPTGWRMTQAAGGAPRFVPAPPVVPGDENWDRRFNRPGVDNAVYSIVVSGALVYVGGQFSYAGDVPAANVAAWDGMSWHALGGGLDSVVFALAISGGTLYAGGSFHHAGEMPAAHIAAWDGTSWHTLGSGMDNDVNALTVSGGTLYAGGWFYSAGGIAAAHRDGVAAVEIFRTASERGE